MKSNDKSSDIAIIGMAAMFSMAPDLKTFWKNIINKVDAVKEASEKWKKHFFDPESKDPDRIYTCKGGFLENLTGFDPTQFGIMPNAVEGGNPDQFLALKLARDAIIDAGYEKKSFNRKKTGVIVGYANLPNRSYINFFQQTIAVDQTLQIISKLCPNMDEETLAILRSGLKEKLLPFSGEVIPSLAPNMLTGRIANRLDLMGPNFIIDAACASTSIAMELAIKELLSNNCDMILTGGVQASTTPLVYMNFCSIDALSHSNIRPFDKNADGTLLGEGLGIFVLKRLADAEKDNDRIYAVIKSIGSASDGKGMGLMAPRLDGEILALERAYKKSCIDPSTIELIEAHGTGIPLGDLTEMSALTEIFGKRKGKFPTCAIGSVKSMISHCIPASGAASLIKTALSLYHKIIPPTICGEVNPQFKIDKTPFYINTETRPWIHGNKIDPRRAGINSFGFGGINTHVILEEYKKPTKISKRSIHNYRPYELFIFSEDTREGLIDLINKSINFIKLNSKINISDLAYTLNSFDKGKERLAIIAKDLHALSSKLQFVIKKLKDHKTDQIQSRMGIYFSNTKHSGKTLIMFPGEGSQYINMLSDLCIYFPRIREWFDLLDEVFFNDQLPKPSDIIFPSTNGFIENEKKLLESHLYSINIGLASVFISSMALYELLSGFGIKCDAMLGHSNGENTALIASGMIRYKDRRHLMKIIKQFIQNSSKTMESKEIPKGTLIAVGAVDPDILEKYLKEKEGSVYLAMDNCINQKVLFGNKKEVEAAKLYFKKIGGICDLLPFDRAYHTPMFKDVIDLFSECYRGVDFGPGKVPLYSCATTCPFPSKAEEIGSLVAKQFYNRVRFRETIEKLSSNQFTTFIEVGPSSNLSSFVEDILKNKKKIVLSSNNRRKGGLEQIHHLLGRLFVNRLDVNLNPLYDSRNLSILPFFDTKDENAGTTPEKKNILNLDLPLISIENWLIKKIQDKIIVKSPGVSRQKVLDTNNNLMKQFLSSHEEILSGLSSQISKTLILTESCFPFLDKVKKNGINPEYSEKFIFKRHFSIANDCFLQDHSLGNVPSFRNTDLFALPLLPFTFSMEILAQAASYMIGKNKKIIAMDNLKGHNWLTLDNGLLDLIIIGELKKNNLPGKYPLVQVKLFKQGKKGKENILVFEGNVEMSGDFIKPPIPVSLKSENIFKSKISDSCLYGENMFHGERLQGVKHIRKWAKEGIEGDIEVLQKNNFFTNIKYPEFKIDPGLIDAAGQLTGYWVIEQLGKGFCTFPLKITKFYRFDENLAPGSKIICRGLINFVNKRTIEANFDLLTPSGKIIGRMEKWQFIYFKLPNRLFKFGINPLNEYFSAPYSSLEKERYCRYIGENEKNFLEEFGGIWKSSLAHLVFNKNELSHWFNLKEEETNKINWLLTRIGAKDTVRQWAKERLDIKLSPADIEIVSTETNSIYARCLYIDTLIPEILITKEKGGWTVCLKTDKII